MFAETEEQEQFERASMRFLETHYPMARVRALAAEASTFEPERWREAARLGWTTLLVPEAAGGGSISGNGLADLLIVASGFGRHAAPGPLLGTNVVAAALGRWGSPPQQAGPLAELVAGDAVGAWAPVRRVDRGSSSAVSGGRRRGRHRRSARPRRRGGGRRRRRVPAGYGGRVGTVIPNSWCRSTRPGSKHAAAQPRPDPAVRRRHARRRRGPVDVRVGPPGAGDEQDADLLDLVAVLALGEIVGAMDRAFEMTLDWAASRYSFGRPLGSYQEIKHRMADLRTQLEAAEAVAARAVFAVGSGRARRPRAGRAPGWPTRRVSGPSSIQDCIQLHGGIGVTFEHDLHLFLRRAAARRQPVRHGLRLRAPPRAGRRRAEGAPA